MVTGNNVCHPGPHFEYNAGTFVTEHQWKRHRDGSVLG
jgi:hypothetical protein